MENIDDIELLDDFKDFLKEEYSNADTYIQAIENLLSRLKTAEKEIEKYKKIAYFLGARYWLKDCEFADKFEELEDVLEWARKKVEENG